MVDQSDSDTRSIWPLQLEVEVTIIQDKHKCDTSSFSAAVSIRVLVCLFCHSNWGIGNTDRKGIKAILESILQDQLSHGQQYPQQQQATPLEQTNAPLQRTTPLAPTQPTNAPLQQTTPLAPTQPTNAPMQQTTPLAPSQYVFDAARTNAHLQQTRVK